MRNSISVLIINLLLLISIINQPCYSNSGFIKTKQAVTYSETWRDDNSWIWQGSVGKPKLTITEDGFIAICAEALENDHRLGYPSLPYFSKIFNALPEDISYHLNGSNPVILPVNGKIERFTDRSKPDNEEFEIPEKVNADLDNLYPRESVSIIFLGYINGLPLTNIKIYPYQLIDNGAQLRYNENLSISLTIRDNSNLSELRKSSLSNLEKALKLNKQTLRSIPTRSIQKQGNHFLLDRALVRITIDSTGIYRIGQSTLKDSAAAIKKVDPRTFQLFNRGIEVPIYVGGESDGSFDKSDYIEFYGQRNPNSVGDYYFDPFTDNNVYFLSWGAKYGLRYAEESAKTTISDNDAIVPTDYEHTAHFEENNHFNNLGKVDTDLPTHTRDHWFFDGGINGGTTESYYFELIYPNTSTIEGFSIDVGMHGLTYQAGSHTVSIHINDYYATADSWSDQAPHVITNGAAQTLQNRYLIHGQNKIRIAVAGDDPANPYDKVLFDYLDIKYKRLYKAFDDRIEFSSPENMPPGTYHFKISGFENPDISVYKIGKSKLIDYSVDYSTLTSNYSVIIEDYIQDNTNMYFAASRLGVLQPKSIQPDTIFNITEEQTATDLIIIAGKQFKYKLGKLTSFYESIGITPIVVGIKDVYNEFNDGIVSPYAIRDYLKYIKDNWSHKPASVLLIGDSKIREQESIPAFFNQSYKYGACASDHWFVVFDDESDIPEYAIGRWPVSNQEELELLIDKRINYSSDAPIGSWRNEMLYIAGYEDAFKNQTENMINRQIPKEFSVNRIFINPSSVNTPFFGGSDTLIYLWNRGLSLINFMGHGGGAVWADRSLFNTTHIEYLDNYDKLPFITSLTCFTADFANITGLGEHLVLSENGGAIGLWGATSVGWIKNDYLMAKSFYDVCFEPGMTVGEAIQYSKIKYLADQYFDYLKYSMVNSYTLIGDPTVVLPFPKETAELTISESNPQAGQTIELSGIVPFNSGEMYTQLYDSATYRVFTEPMISAIENGSVQQSLTLPLAINPGNTFINYYFHNSDLTNDGNGVTLISIRGLNFYNLITQPEFPKKNEEFNIFIRTELADIDSLICELDTSNAYEYLDENGIEFVNSFSNSTNIIRIDMLRDGVEPNKWFLNMPFKIGTAGKLIGVRFVAVDQSLNRKYSENFSVKIKREPDLSVLHLSQGGVVFPQLVIDINYTGDDTIKSTVSAYYISNQTETLLNTREFTLLPNRSSSHSIPGILGIGQQTFKIVIDPDNKINEINESNNTLTDSLFVNTFLVLPSIGSSYFSTHNDTITFENCSVFIEPNSVIDSSVLIIQEKTIPQNTHQPQFSIIADPETDTPICYNVSCLNLQDSLSKPLVINILNQKTVFQDVAIARYDPTLKIWILLSTEHHTDSYGAKSAYPGQFTLVRCQDSESPSLELSLDGQQFFQNSYVSRKPNFSIIAEDENGVLFNESGMRVYLDGNLVNFADLNIPDTLASGNYISAQFRPELEYGDHDIEVIIKDAAGNSANDQILFTVSDELKLIDYGNYPNPFKDRTVFIYELTQRVDDFKIKIYSGSGRLIKILEESNSYNTGLDMSEGGYHEILWNGLDEDGNFIANGVYFYKMIAQNDSKTVSKIGKLAKAR